LSTCLIYAVSNLNRIEPTGNLAGRSVAVIGTGAFATDLCRNLAAIPASPVTVYVVGRNRDAAAAICDTARAAAAVAGAPVTLCPVFHPLGPAVDFRALLAELRPGTVVVCASCQSPAEIRHGDNEWSRLVRQAGFGVTIPLQAALAARVAAACAALDPPPAMINACFPDAVNATLRAQGWPVLCGLGNVASLADVAATALGIAEPRRLKLLAHHAHLRTPGDPSLEARCWLDDEPYPDLPRLLAEARGTPGHLNARGAAAAARLVAALLDGDVFVGHVPGPAGLPGGYPVEIDGQSIALRLPPGVRADAAVRWNERVSVLDGVTVDTTGTVRLTERAIELLARYWANPPTVVPADALPELCRRQLALRARLRRDQAPAAFPHDCVGRPGRTRGSPC
jgi:hypothetical protein